MQYCKHCTMRNTFQQSKYSTSCVETTLRRLKNTQAYKIKDISGLHQWSFFIFSPIINKTTGLILL